MTEPTLGVTSTEGIVIRSALIALDQRLTAIETRLLAVEKFRDEILELKKKFEPMLPMIQQKAAEAEKKGWKLFG